MCSPSERHRGTDRGGATPPRPCREELRPPHRSPHRPRGLTGASGRPRSNWRRRRAAHAPADAGGRATSRRRSGATWALIETRGWRQQSLDIGHSGASDAARKPTHYPYATPPMHPAHPSSASFMAIRHRNKHPIPPSSQCHPANATQRQLTPSMPTTSK